MKKLILGPVAISTIIACTPKTTEVISNAEDTALMPTNIVEGKTLYVNNCGKCHKLKDIDAFTREHWDKVLMPMVQKSKLTDEDGKKIDDYVNWELKH